jgi:hypothetical protein
MAVKGTTFPRYRMYSGTFSSLPKISTGNNLVANVNNPMIRITIAA